MMDPIPTDALPENQPIWKGKSSEPTSKLSKPSFLSFQTRSNFFGGVVTLPKNGPQKETKKYSNHPFSGAKILVSGRVYNPMFLFLPPPHFCHIRDTPRHIADGRHRVLS